MSSEHKSFMAASAIVSLEPAFENVVTTNFQGLPHHGSAAQIHTLFLLQEVGDLTLSEIAKHHNVSKAYISQLIPQMEQEELVYRFNREGNKKFTYVSITDKGTQKLTDFVFHASKNLADILDGIPESDKDQIIICCNRLKSIFDRNFRNGITGAAPEGQT